MDEDGSGAISPKELKVALKEMNIKIDTKMLAELWRALDADGSGDIGRAEFVGMIENEGDNEMDANDEIQKLMDESGDHSSPVAANVNTSGGGGGGGIPSALAQSKAEAGATTVDAAPALEKSKPVLLERAAETPESVSATSTTGRARAFEQARVMIAEMKAADEAILERQHEMLRRLESIKTAHATVAHASGRRR